MPKYKKNLDTVKFTVTLPKAVGELVMNEADSKGMYHGQFIRVLFLNMIEDLKKRGKVKTGKDGVLTLLGEI